MKSLMFAFAALFSLSSVVHAECAGAYKDQIKAIEGRLNPPRTTLISNLVAEAVVVGVTVAVSGTVAPLSVIALPAAAVGAGAYFGTLAAERADYRSAMHLIANAHKGSGEELDRFMKKLNHFRRDSKVNREDVIGYLTQNDFDNKFCVQNERTERYKLAGYFKLLRLVNKEFPAKE